MVLKDTTNVKDNHDNRDNLRFHVVLYLSILLCTVLYCRRQARSMLRFVRSQELVARSKLKNKKIW